MPPKFDKVKNVTAAPSSTAVLICSARAVPNPTISWFKNDEILPDDEEKYSIIDEIDDTNHISTLSISNIEENDVAIYRCSFSNSHGDESRNISLLVQGNGNLLYALSY